MSTKVKELFDVLIINVSFMQPEEQIHIEIAYQNLIINFILNNVCTNTMKTLELI